MAATSLRLVFDLSRPEDAYLFGLLQTDGTHEGSVDGKGRVTIELAERDVDVLHALQSQLPCYSSIGYRERATNFTTGTGYRSASLRFYSQSARQRLAELGLPTGAKAHTAVPPVSDLSAADYVRGLVDGDGSLGTTTQGYPYLSFVTASEPLARYFEATIHTVTGAARHSNRNSRDCVFNIMVANQSAVSLVKWLYYPGALGLHRKAGAAAAMMSWVPPNSRFGTVRKRWTAEEDEVVLASSSDIDAAEKLSRTAQSVSMRRWRLTKPA